MPEISGSRLATLTGKGWRTVRAKLAAALVGLDAAAIQEKIDNAIRRMLDDLADYKPGRRHQ